MSTYGAAKLLAETVGVSPDDVFINLVEVQRENWSFGKGVRARRNRGGAIHGKDGRTLQPMVSDWTDDRHVRSDRPGRRREDGRGRLRTRARADAPQSQQRARRRRCDKRTSHQSQRVPG